MRTKGCGVVLSVAAVALLTACQSSEYSIIDEVAVAEERSAGDVRTMRVGPAMADGVGIGPMTCLMVKESEDANYGLFYSSIKGFDYVPGFEYELKVRVTERDRVPADASKYIYTLVEVVSKKPAGLALEGTTWELIDAVEGSAVTVRFEDGKVTGNGGVNQFFGGYEVNGTELEIGNLGASMMAGPPSLMDQEGAFIGALGGSVKYMIVDGRLRLFNAAGRINLELTPAVELILTSGEWNATGINNGKGGVSSLIAGTTVFIQFEEDGTVSGDAGCNQFGGSYEIDGASIKFGPMRSTRMTRADPPGVMEQESNFLRALDAAATFRIEGKRLELRAADGALQIGFAAAEK